MEFLEMVNSRDRYLESLHEKKQREEEQDVELGYLREEIAKLKAEFSAIQRQNENLQQALRERSDTQASVRKQIVITPRKRPRCSELEDDDSDLLQSSNPIKPLSRERIRYVLGGFDRGWGLTQSQPLRGFMCYSTHALLDVGHLFGKRPSRREGIAKALLGFGDTDEEVISRGIPFPLFVRRLRGHGSPFYYLGNYVAIKVGQVAWEKLSPEERESSLETLVGLAGKHFLQKIRDKKMKPATYIRNKTIHDNYHVPCCRLEFRYFDQDLKVSIQHSPRRRR